MRFLLVILISLGLIGCVKTNLEHFKEYTYDKISSNTDSIKDIKNQLVNIKNYLNYRDSLKRSCSEIASKYLDKAIVKVELGYVYETSVGRCKIVTEKREYIGTPSEILKELLKAGKIEYKRVK